MGSFSPPRQDGLSSGLRPTAGAAQNDDLNAGLESDTFRVKVQVVPASVQTACEQEIPDLSGPSPPSAGQGPPIIPRELQRRRSPQSLCRGMGRDRSSISFPLNFLVSASFTLGSHGVRLFSRGAVNLCSIPVTLNAAQTDCMLSFGSVFFLSQRKKKSLRLRGL